MPLPGPLMKMILAPIMRPTARFIVGLLAIPVLRAIRSRVAPEREWDEELERDLEQWFRASAVLFLATKNVEELLAEWMAVRYEVDMNLWFIVAGRLLLAVGVVETMPDQQLFSLIHPGPRLNWNVRLGLWGNIREQALPFLRGIGCLYLSRSSPVYAILAVIYGGQTGWLFFWLAIAQYLFIGLVTSRDKALDVLQQFDREVAQRREDLIREFEIEEQTPAGEIRQDAVPKEDKN